MEDVGIFMAIWSNFRTFWYILCHFGIIYGHLVYFSSFGIIYHEKSGNPGYDSHVDLDSVVTLSWSWSGVAEHFGSSMFTSKFTPI
jgi:hypothetical protein